MIDYMNTKVEPYTTINGNTYWAINANYFHRLSGPAIEWNDGTVSYYICNICLTKKEYKKEVEMLCICFNY
jgi:hypothetical protein